MPSGLYTFQKADGSQVQVFVDSNVEERWIESQVQLQQWDEEAREAERERTRQCMLELSMPDPDDEEERDRSYLVRIPGLRRVWNHPLLK